MAKIDEIVRVDHRVSIRMTFKTVNTDKETVRKILQDKLKTKKVCATLIPKNLTPYQNFIRQQICSDFLERLDEEPGILAMKPKYSNVMLKVTGNPCAGKLLHHLEWKE